MAVLRVMCLLQQRGKRRRCPPPPTPCREGGSLEEGAQQAGEEGEAASTQGMDGCDGAGGADASGDNESSSKAAAPSEAAAVAVPAPAAAASVTKAAAAATATATAAPASSAAVLALNRHQFSKLQPRTHQFRCQAAERRVGGRKPHAAGHLPCLSSSSSSSSTGSTVSLATAAAAAASPACISCALRQPPRWPLCAWASTRGPSLRCISGCSTSTQQQQQHTSSSLPSRPVRCGAGMISTECSRWSPQLQDPPRRPLHPPPRRSGLVSPADQSNIRASRLGLFACSWEQVAESRSGRCCPVF